MKKLWDIIKHSFSYESQYTKYRYEFLIYFGFLLIYSLIALIIWLIDKEIEKYSIWYRINGLVLAFFVLLLFFQTMSFPCRLLGIKSNKFDLSIVKGKNLFENEPISLEYKMFKKIVRNIDFCIKFYIQADDNSVHIIGINVFVHNREGLAEKRFYFDNVECGFEKTMLLINDKKLIMNNKVLIVGSDLKTINQEIINKMVEDYCKNKDNK